MAERIGRLEKDVGEIKGDLKAVRTDLAFIKGKLSAMPSTLQLIGFAIAVFVAAGLLRVFQG